ncbi:DNA-binding transcriptional regulator, XRE-family HTH domain [Cruoricaptor ignavus]|uniref:DNA-binding transcriptional regulator, XRE-family HTH domain n=2 Tax=Cruoricaptor ignavus TaxID=1118202 RepID=A0A1M6H2Y8_9FLAO|nr:DNA-binding transcriptional regulator, XRE-family HTH domain [Cruoricaptor ignavus]
MLLIVDLNTQVSRMRSEILIQFGSRVRELRKTEGLSQEDLADKADLHRTYIGMIERGEKNITLQNIYRIAQALNIDIMKLFAFEEETKKN